MFTFRHSVLHPLLLLATPFVTFGHDDLSQPEIRTEIRKDEKGKDITWMWIDGIKVHETDPLIEPQPPIVTPGTNGSPPSDAIVLFDGSRESFEQNWIDENGKGPVWNFADGAMESVKKAGRLVTREEFGSCQLHLEFATPKMVMGDGQKRGNSGVFLMGRYEVQILDNYNNETYPDGQAGALYGRKKPLVNACRAPGEWQTYDIIFRRPRFDKNGNVVERATFTVLHNGVLVQNHTVLTGGTQWIGPHAVTPYEAHGDTGPIALQDHGNPVRFRNVWIRKLED
jgi:hypothetical protein